VSALRDTWLNEVTIDYKIFKGRCPKGLDIPTQGDEVWLNVPDDYRNSVYKLKGIINYALEREYDTLCKIDDDVFAYWDRLIAVGLEGDYSGRLPVDDGFSVNCPGFTYWLSKRSMEILAAAPVHIWAEDRWVGEVLKKHHITPVRQNLYHLAKWTRTCQWITDEELKAVCNNVLSIHAMSPDQMRRHYAEICKRRVDDQLARQASVAASTTTEDNG
jgi:hypothetical protein